MSVQRLLKHLSGTPLALGRSVNPSRSCIDLGGEAKPKLEEDVGESRSEGSLVKVE